MRARIYKGDGRVWGVGGYRYASGLVLVDISFGRRSLNLSWGGKA